MVSPIELSDALIGGTKFGGGMAIGGKVSGSSARKALMVVV